MKKLIAGGVAVLLAVGVAAATVSPASAFGYYPYYHHYGYGYGYGYGPGAGLAAGILGFAAGAAIAGAAVDDRDHVEACFEAYKSYDRRTDTYLGYDGYRHRCLL